jgi:hypothetical protein
MIFEKYCKLCFNLFYSKWNFQKYCCSNCCNKANYILIKNQRRDKYFGNREFYKNRSLRYYYQNREKILNYQIKRLEILKKVSPKIKEKYRLRILSQKYISLKDESCAKCNSKKDLQRHHFDNHDAENIQILCRKCHNNLHESLKPKNI